MFEVEDFDEEPYSPTDFQRAVVTSGASIRDEDEPEDVRMVRELVRLIQNNGELQHAILRVVLNCPNIKWEL